MPQDPQALVDELAALLGASATLEDRHFNLIAFNAQTEAPDQIRLASILRRRSTTEVRQYFENFGIATATAPLRIPQQEALGIAARWCLPARWRQVTYGYLWLLEGPLPLDPALLPAAHGIAERAGAALAQLTRARLNHELLIDQLTAGDPELADEAASELDALALIRRGTPLAVVVCSTAHLDEPLAAQGPQPSPARPVVPPPGPGPLTIWTLPRRVLTSSSGAQLTAIVPLSSLEDLSPAIAVAKQVLELHAERHDERLAGLGSARAPRAIGAGAGAGVGVGIGSAQADPGLARTSFLQARLAATLAVTEPSLGPIASWNALGVHRLLSLGPRRALHEAAVDPRVRPLLATSQSDLAHTARTYLDLAGDAQRTAGELCIHRQTLYQRLRRIEEVSGLNLRDGRDRLVLHLGLSLAGALAADHSLEGERRGDVHGH